MVLHFLQSPQAIYDKSDHRNYMHISSVELFKLMGPISADRPLGFIGFEEVIFFFWLDLSSWFNILWNWQHKKLIYILQSIRNKTEL